MEHSNSSSDGVLCKDPLAPPRDLPTTTWTIFCGTAQSALPYRVITMPIPVDPLDLFRRAVVEGDQAAWDALYAQYQHLVRTWLRRHAAAALTDEADDYLINRTFERFWMYVKPDRFASFAGLPALLQYLKLCAHGVLLDEVRSQTRKQTVPVRDQAQPLASDDIIEREAAHTLWQAIRATARDESDLLIAQLSFIHGLKPREIYGRYPEHFASVAEVYRIKRNLLDRLRRDETILLSYA